MFTTQNKDSNYLAKIVRLGPPRKHTNADRLLCHTVEFNNVITDLSYKEGDLVIYFPLECQINKDLISSFNGFQKRESNKNTEIRGFFDNNGRVRAVRLRQEVSAGLILKLEVFLDWLAGEKYSITDEKVCAFNEQFKIKDLIGLDFDSFKINNWCDSNDEILICQKYIIPVKNPQNPNRVGTKREYKIVDGQFKVSSNTSALKRNIDKVNPEDIITISYKMHGRNAAIGRVLCKRKLSIIEKLARLLGVKVDESHYDLVYASRTLIRNQFTKDSANNDNSDLWKIHSSRVHGKLQDGITLYCEIVGYFPDGSYVQKDYDYGLPPGQSELYVYRITYTKPNGEVIEFTTPQIQRYCNKFGIKTVPIFYYGKAKDYAKQISSRILDDGLIKSKLDEENNWHKTFLELLMWKHNEKDCYICTNKVPEEGVVLNRENECFEAYKLKSFKFLERETVELDKGEPNTEDVGDS